MRTVKNSTVDQGLLRKTTKLKVCAIKSCKWQAKHSVCSRFGALFDDLAQLSAEERSKLSFDVRFCLMFNFDLSAINHF